MYILYIYIYSNDIGAIATVDHVRLLTTACVFARLQRLAEPAQRELLALGTKGALFCQLGKVMLHCA